MKKIYILIATIFLGFGLTMGASAFGAVLEEEDGSQSYDFEEFPVMTDIPPKSPEMLEKMESDPQPTMSFANLPSQFSWLNYGGNWMTPAKDQANCGSCWAFGALGGMEAGINIASGYPDLDLDLSEQYVLSCLPAAGSCGGGWMSEAIMYIHSTSPGSTGNGINGNPIEACMPYTAKDYIPCADKCQDWDYYTVPPEPDNKLWQVKDYGVTTISEDSVAGWNLLKTWCITYGPVIVDIYTGGWSGFWSNNHDPNMVYENDDSGITNHAQVLCGWVDDPTIYNGGYWILKNSWGTGWGYNGYSNIAYGCNSLGTRDVTWVTTIDWPEHQRGPGPGTYDMHVFCDWSYESQYPHLGEEVEFNDDSDGDVILREWDLNGDGVIDSNKKSPTYTYNTEGEYEVTLTVWSEWGLHSNRTRIVEVREIWPPEAICSPDEYVDNELEYSFDGRYSYDVDGGDIVSYHWDFDDGTTSNEQYLTHTFPEGDKIYDVTLTVTDNDGASSSATCTVKIDISVPPETKLLRGLGADGSTWYSTTQRIAFDATDWTSVYDTFYRVDNGEWTLYTPEEQEYIPIGTEGMHTIDFYSVDYYGNEEEVKSETFGIDKTDPIIDVSVLGEKINGWYTSSVSVSITGDDELSGLDQIIYKVDQAGWKEFNGGLTIEDGPHQLWCYAVDTAGNIHGDDEPMRINVDTDVPTSTCILDGEGSSGMFYKTVDVKLAAVDAGAGVDTIYYSLDDGSFTEYFDAVTVDSVGDHTVSYYAVDNIGNKEQTKTLSFSISPVNFMMNLEQPSNYLYFFNIELFTTSRPIIIGAVDIIVDVESFTGGTADISYVDFLVDGESLMIDSQTPYIWRLDEQMFGVHEIEVQAITNDGMIVSESIEAQLFIF